MERLGVFWPQEFAGQKMTCQRRSVDRHHNAKSAVITSGPAQKLRCAVYTRKSSEEGLDMDFNSLDAQRESCEAYIASQKAEGWMLTADRYDDGGFSGGTMERPALKRLLADLEAGKVNVIV